MSSSISRHARHAPTRPSRRGVLAGAGAALAASTLSACGAGGGSSQLTLYQSKPEAIPFF